MPIPYVCILKSNGDATTSKFSRIGIHFHELFDQRTRNGTPAHTNHV